MYQTLKSSSEYYFNPDHYFLLWMYLGNRTADVCLPVWALELFDIHECKSITRRKIRTPVSQRGRTQSGRLTLHSLWSCPPARSVKSGGVCCLKSRTGAGESLCWWESEMDQIHRCCTVEMFSPLPEMFWLLSVFAVTHRSWVPPQTSSLLNLMRGISTIFCSASAS